MGAQMSSMNKVSFEDLQWLIKRNPNNYILINTLGPNDQDCLVKETSCSCLSKKCSSG